jgi:hypothetical protein
VAKIVVGTPVVGQEVHRVVLHDVFRMLSHEFFTRRKEGMRGSVGELVSVL